MSAFERALARLDPGTAETLRRLDERLALAQILLRKFAPDLDPSTPEYARVLIDYLDCVEMALEADMDAGLDEEDDASGFRGPYHG